MRTPHLVTAACAFVVAAASVWTVGPAKIATAAQKEKGPDQAAINRTREQIQMLDHLYKTAVVGINDTYVAQQQDVPAAMVAAQVFAEMRKKGYHDARLVDVTGKPKHDENVAKTPFEKDGKPVLRAATLVPAVNKTCAACHRVKVGDKLGTIVYEVPIK